MSRMRTAIFICFLALCGCEKPSGQNTFATTMGLIAVTSPAAPASTETSLFGRGKNAIFSALEFSGTRWLLNYFGFHRAKIARAEESTSPTEIKAIDTLLTEMTDAINSTNPNDLATDLADFTDKVTYRASCYGPSWKDDATNDLGATSTRPSGDLGMVHANASPTDTTACAAAQMNALIGGYPNFVNRFLKLQAMLVAVLNQTGQLLPAVNGEISGLASFPSVDGVSFTTAKLERIADVDGHPVYKSSFAGTNDDDEPFSIAITHSPEDEMNATFKGLIQADMPHSGGGAGTHWGLSMVYEQRNAVISYVLETAANRDVDSNNFFDATTGRIDFTKAAFGEDGNKMIAKFSKLTNEGILHYAWQAGSGDGAVRAFHAYVPPGAEGNLAGVAYFGFGGAMTSLTDDTSPLWTTKMHCNWMDANSGGTAGSTTANIAKIQKQTFTQSNGKFISASTNISFAPTDSCECDGGANTGPGDNCDPSFTVSDAVPTSYNGVRTVSTHNLVDPPTIADGLAFPPVVDVPTFTLP